MKKEVKKNTILGITFIAAFAIWTALVQTVDVQPVGANGTDIGFADFNCWFHKLTGVNMTLYVVTDWLGLVPLFVCLIFAAVGLIQLVKRRSLLKVDFDILVLGVYYVLVIIGYLAFEMIVINYRPILINNALESSYPSSTTLLVLAVMATLFEQANRRIKNHTAKKAISIFLISFSLFMVTGRLICGVHWFTDIVGSVLLTVGLFCIYKAIVMFDYKK